ncbi:MAG: hypothetical protein WAU61_15460 [Smithella sp.]
MKKFVLAISMILFIPIYAFSEDTQLYTLRPNNPPIITCNNKDILAQVLFILNHPDKSTDKILYNLKLKGNCQEGLLLRRGMTPRSDDPFLYKIYNEESITISLDTYKIASINVDGDSRVVYVLRDDLIPYKTTNEIKQELVEKGKKIMASQPVIIGYETPDTTKKYGCHFNAPNAIACLAAQNAAYAYQNYGFDYKRINLSYNRQLLHEASCGVYNSPNYKNEILGIIEAGRIATPNGWVKVIQISNNTGVWWVARDYISCKIDPEKHQH